MEINMSTKDKLYFALKDFVTGNYRTEDFCSWFSILYFHELNYDDLNEIEYKLFNELANIADRFSPYEEDLIIPNVYFNEREVFEKAKETYNILINE